MISAFRSRCCPALVLALAMSALPAFTAQQAAPAGVETYTIDANHSEASFRIRHLVTKVTGQVDVAPTGQLFTGVPNQPK